jgi:hypothetical protein
MHCSSPLIFENDFPIARPFLNSSVNEYVRDQRSCFIVYYWYTWSLASFELFRKSLAMVKNHANVLCIHHARRLLALGASLGTTRILGKKSQHRFRKVRHTLARPIALNSSRGIQRTVGAGAGKITLCEICFEDGGTEASFDE